MRAYRYDDWTTPLEEADVRAGTLALLLACVLTIALTVRCAGDPVDGEGDVLQEVAQDTTGDAQDGTEEAEVSGCPLDEACDDQDPCTTNDRCRDDGCRGSLIPVDDQLTCTEDRCDPDGAIVHELLAGACLIDGTCYQGGQVDPQNPCRVCDLGQAEAWTSNDGVACTDGDECTEGDVCADGACQGVARACDDQNPCTFDRCEPGVGCVHEAVLMGCEDGDACTEDDLCEDAECHPGTPVDCDDGDLCTLDSCDPAVGCEHAADELVCDDGNPCTLDACDATAQQCSYEVLPDGTPCDDADACSLGDTCAAGACEAGPEAPQCDDGNGCTEDLCLPEVGCVNAFTADPCDDGFECTTDDQCMYGTCLGNDLYCGPCEYEVIGQLQKSTAILLGNDGHPGSGIDVDQDPTTCAPSDDCSAGINNAIAPLAAFINPAFESAHEQGSMVFIVELEDPTSDGQPFTLNTMFGVLDPYVPDNDDCPITSTDCVYRLPSYNFGPDCEPKVSFDNAALQGGIVSAGGTDYSFPLYLPLEGGVTVQMTMLWARIEGTVVMDEATGEVISIAGSVGGAVPKENLYSAVENVPDDYFPLPKETVLNMLDVLIEQDVDLDGDGVNDASSVGFRFNTIVGQVSL